MKASRCKNERQERSDRRKTGRKGSGRKKILLDDYRDLFNALIFSCVCSSCTLNLNLNTNLKQDSYEWEKRRRERWRTSSSVASSSSSNFFAVRKKIVQVLVFCNRWRPWQWWSRPLTLSRPSAFVAKVFFPDRQLCSDVATFRPLWFMWQPKEPQWPGGSSRNFLSFSNDTWPQLSQAKKWKFEPMLFVELASY